MLSISSIENTIKELKPVLNIKYKVNKIGYFGSYATGNATETSDIDILVEFSEPIGWEFFDMQDLLEKKLKCKVDLVSIKALKEQLKDVIINQVRFV